ncbi:YbaB/EbfC family nucleoid-associated protein [Actinomadura sp. DC4]|uniref:YbaB/EbfC family nucleoid-associated protein n=1 Tax=Actinomadura sp. DC4 TaxID=3055069 RepID=UPI0025B25417|nr:YbaB/EbfC family nucleoid-associated protein [Actinomadura sp. DC4]MDN3359226.1 YbaB/EbfC family nucleoid-associated protein [Actinomadura sp. DC4]
MSNPQGFDLEHAIADLRAEQARIKEATEHMASLTGSAMSKDRMITATVDSRGRLVDLTLEGTRYRKLAPAELTKRIVDIVREAQEDAARTAASTLTGLLPDGLGMPVNGDFDMEAMFDAAVTTARATAETKREGAGSDG